MTDTEKAALCARIDELCQENERLRSVVSDGADNARELRAENAKLSQQLVDVTESMGRIEKRCAKLREQVDYMTPIAWYAASERERDRMRELRIGEEKEDGMEA